MDLKAIQSYLSNPSRNPQQGIVLYLQFGKNKVLRRKFQRNPNQWAAEKAEVELRKMAGVYPAPQIQPPAREQLILEESPDPIPVPDEPAKPHSTVTFPEPLNKRIVEMRKLYNQRGQLSNTLISFSPAETQGRKQTVDRILGLTAGIKEIQTEKEYFLDHGKLKPQVPKMEKVIPSDPGEVVNSRNNLRTRISKTKRKLATLTSDDPTWTKYELKLQQLIQETQELENLIKNAEN